MKKTVKKAQVGKTIKAKQLPKDEKFRELPKKDSLFKKSTDSTVSKLMNKKYSKPKSSTDVLKDEMGNPRTKAQQKQWEKDELEMIDYKGRPKMKSGGSLGMKSVKAGYDKNPGVTRADIIVAGKKQAKKGAKIGAKKKMMGGGKCKYGCK